MDIARDGNGKRSPLGPQSRFLPIDWKFIKESPLLVRSSCASSSPTPRFLTGSVLPSSTLPSYRSSPASSPSPPCLKKQQVKSPFRGFGTKQDGCEAAEAEYKRRLSHARNLYDRLHLCGEEKATGVKFEENQRRLGRMEVTALYRRHLEKRNLRIPVAIRGIAVSPTQK